MALISCSECGRDVSDRAAVCPWCGCPIEVSKAANASRQGGQANGGSSRAGPRPPGQPAQQGKNNHTISVVALALFLVILWQASPIGALGHRIWYPTGGSIVITSRTPLPAASPTPRGTPAPPTWNMTDPNAQTNGNLLTATNLIQTSGIAIQQMSPPPAASLASNPAQAIGQLYAFPGAIQAVQPADLTQVTDILGSGTQIDDVTLADDNTSPMLQCDCYAIGGIGQQQPGATATIYGYVVGYNPSPDTSNGPLVELSVLGLGNPSGISLH